MIHCGECLDTYTLYTFLYVVLSYTSWVIHRIVANGSCSERAGENKIYTYIDYVRFKQSLWSPFELLEYKVKAFGKIWYLKLHYRNVIKSIVLISRSVDKSFNS